MYSTLRPPSHHLTPTTVSGGQLDSHQALRFGESIVPAGRSAGGLPGQIRSEWGKWSRSADGQISSTVLGVRRIIMDAATSSTAPTTVKTKCHQLQLNCLVTATDEADVDEHP
jgi:hypothetical protein